MFHGFLKKANNDACIIEVGGVVGATPQNTQVALFGTAPQKLKLGCLVLNYQNLILLN